MPATFNGRRILFPDEKLRKFVSDFRLFDSLKNSQAHNGVSLNRASHHLVPNSLTIAPPNYPQHSVDEINVLYVPTGATRWSEMFVLMAQSDYQNVSDLLLNSKQNPGQLKIFDELGLNTIDLRMYLLQAERVTFINSGQNGDEYLWLLRLVDARYFWQFTTPELTITSATTWKTLFDSVKTSVPGVLELDGSISDYDVPDAQLFTQFSGENSALILEAIAGSLGRCVCPKMTLQQYSVMNTVEANAFDSIINRLDNSKIVAGFDGTKPVVPHKVKVNFGRRVLSQVVSGAKIVELNTESLLQSPTNFSIDTSWIHTIYSSMTARYATHALNAADGTPINNATLQALANAIAREAILWKHTPYRLTFAGIKKWIPTGFDDAVWFRLDRSELGKHSVSTIVQSLPHNVWINQNASAETFYTPWNHDGGFVFTTPAGGIPANGSAVCTMTNSSGTDIAGETVEVFNNMSTAVAATIKAQAKLNRYGKYYVDVEQC